MATPAKENIYVLRDGCGCVFYIGRTKYLPGRLARHRLRFGNEMSAEVIEECSGIKETPAEAEARWIKQYLEQGCQLKNVYKSKLPPGKTRRNSELRVFAEQEMNDILVAARRMTWPGRPAGEFETMTLVLRFTGIKICDLSVLRRENIQSGCLVFRTSKDSILVRFPLPEWLERRIVNVPTKRDGTLFNLSPSARIETRSDLLRRAFSRIFADAGVENGSFLAFRHTLVRSLVQKGTDPWTLCKLLGIDSTYSIDRAYGPWFTDANERMSERVRHLLIEPAISKTENEAGPLFAAGGDEARCHSNI